MAQSLLRVWDVRLDECSKLHERLLPTEVAHFHRDHGRDAFLRNAEVRPTEHFLQDDRCFHHARKLGVIKLIVVPYFLTRNQFQIRPTEALALPRREVRKRHLVLPTNGRVHRVHGSRKTIRWEPFAHRICGDECLVHAFSRCPEHAVQMNGIGRGHSVTEGIGSVV